VAASVSVPRLPTWLWAVGLASARAVRPPAYRLEKLDGPTYDIDATAPEWRCDCPDATYRNRECKHVKALRAALSAAAK
jgi:hypothetical protein